MLIGGCETVANRRGQGLYRRALNDTALALRTANIDQVYVEVRPENLPSIRGIKAAGFVELGLVKAEIWLGGWVRRDEGWSRLRRGNDS